MPLADLTGRVAGIGEDVGNGDFAGRQSGYVVVRIVDGIILVAEAMLIPAGHESGARGTAEWVRDAGIGETHAGLGETIDVRSGEVFAALETDVGEAKVIGEDHDDVGFARGRRKLG